MPLKNEADEHLMICSSAYLFIDYFMSTFSVPSMSEGTFLRKFRIVFGTTPYDYCVKLRMEKARKLMDEQGLSKKEVYTKVGYKDLGSFSRTYRSYYGNKKDL